jgi:ABC-type nitrate/sulfonate/bicarbonate transport system substrate-binding protein
MLDLLKRALVGGAVAIALTVGAQAGEIRLLSFGGATNLPIWMAQEKGFMEKEGVKLTFATTSGSVEQIRDFYAGKYDVISTAFDNIVAYAEGQSDIPLPGPFDMFAFMGGHGGMNTLMVRPEIKGYADIKGKTVAVDALKSGYGIVLYQILKDKGGLEYDKDYKAISVGNTDKRIEAMRGEKAVAAIIGSPQDMAVEREGYRMLADAAQELGAYQGTAFVTRRPYAAQKEADLVAFARAMSKAQDHVFANKADAEAAMTNYNGVQLDGKPMQISVDTTILTLASGRTSSSANAVMAARLMPRTSASGVVPGAEKREKRPGCGAEVRQGGRMGRAGAGRAVLHAADGSRRLSNVV